MSNYHVSYSIIGQAAHIQYFIFIELTANTNLID